MPREREVPPLTHGFREAMYDLRAEYSAGSNSRFRPQPPGVVSTGSGADYHYKDETKYLRMIERSRHYDRNNMVVGQGVNRLCANILKDGFVVDQHTRDKGLDREFNARWYEWAEDEDQCDVEGEKNFYQFEHLALRHTIVDGDIFNLPLTSGHLQAVEGHRPRTPNRTKQNVVHGIKLDPTSAKRLEYWITKEDLDPLKSNVLMSDIQPYAARDAEGHRQVFHLYDPRRFSQRRGVTAFAPCVDPIGMHDDLQFATLVKAMVASCFAIFEEQEIDPRGRKGGNDKPVKTGDERLDDLADGSTRTIQGASPGMRVRGKPGVKFQGFAPNIPNPEFFPHATLILSFIAINLDLPVCVLLLDPSKTNFSGWRGALDQARIRFKQIQNWLRFHFHRRIYRWKVRQWMTEDKFIARVQGKTDKIDPFGHTWHPPGWDYIEPTKDAAADLLRERNLLTSRRRRHAERGNEWRDISTEIVADNSLVLEKAYRRWQRLKKKYPDWDLKWRELVSLPTPDGIQLSIDTSDGDADMNAQPPAAGAAK